MSGRKAGELSRTDQKVVPNGMKNASYAMKNNRGNHWLGLARIELSVPVGFWMSCTSWLKISVRKFPYDGGSTAAGTALLVLSTGGAAAVRGDDANADPDTPW